MVEYFRLTEGKSLIAVRFLGFSGARVPGIGSDRGNRFSEKRAEAYDGKNVALWSAKPVLWMKAQKTRGHSLVPTQHYDPPVRLILA